MFPFEGWIKDWELVRVVFEQEKITRVVFEWFPSPKKATKVTGDVTTTMLRSLTRMQFSSSLKYFKA